MNPTPLTIDIVSDVVCPWCIIGYKRLERALDRLDHRFQVELRWHPFELNPQMPTGGQNLREHIMQKYGTTAEDSIAARKKLTALGAEVGFAFNFHDEMRMVNTFKAHQLLYWAAGSAAQTRLKLTLFEAYFNHRENIDETEVLVAAVERAGLDPVEARRVIADERNGIAVRQAESVWLQRGINAVPAYIFNHATLVSGAQDTERFVALLSSPELESSAGRIKQRRAATA